MSLFRNSIFGGTRDKPAPIPEQQLASKQQQQQEQNTAPATQPRPQRVIHHPEIVHHSTLLLLEKHNLSQEPPGLWKDKMVYETPGCKSDHALTVFDPDSPARQAENKLKREIKARKAERTARSLEPGWLEGPAQQVVRSLEDLEDIRSELREAGRWENIYLEVRERRKDNARISWFGKELEEERKCRLVVAAGLRSVRAPEWTHEFEPPTAAQLESSAASIRSSRRASAGSFVVPSPRENRFSMLSLSTTRSTPRSSIMSVTTRASTVSSPASSTMPSPTLSTTEQYWKGTGPDSPLSEKPAPLSLPPPLVSL